MNFLKVFFNKLKYRPYSFDEALSDNFEWGNFFPELSPSDFDIVEFCGEFGFYDLWRAYDFACSSNVFLFRNKKQKI